LYLTPCFVAYASAIFDKVLFDALYGLCNADDNRLVNSINHPLPLTTQQTIEVKVLLSVLAGMFVLIPFCYVPGAFVVALVKEVVVKSKFLQVASGAKESAFWVSCYLWDVTLYSVLVTLVMCVMLGYKSAEVFVGNASSFFCTAALFWGYGLSIIPFSYLIARRFRYVYYGYCCFGSVRTRILTIKPFLILRATPTATRALHSSR